MHYQVVLGCSVPWSNESPLENKELNAIIGACSSSSPADNVPADSSSSVPADYVSAGHVLVSADRDRIC
ncbi:hypothetical protein Tco_0068521 [Tanacetum coccineum]